MQIEEKYMLRALALAANGRGYTRSNPMVGAVIVDPSGKIIGEGWHRLYGQGHAEVNAIASVGESDRPKLKESTIYVTLEPCSHYGKTPPCSKLIVDTGIPRVVVGATDPNPKVNGRGIAMLSDAGVEVVTGVLAAESEALNRKFFTAQRLGRPFITLKWAQSADGFMDDDSSSPFRFSTEATRLTTMQLRADHEALLTTASTVNADNPRMNLRNWMGYDPKVFIVDRSGALDLSKTLAATATILNQPTDFKCGKVDFQRLLTEHGVSSVLVEAGPRYLQSLLDAGLWDEVRVEVSPAVLGAHGCHPAPMLPEDAALKMEQKVDGNLLRWYAKKG